MSRAAIRRRVRERAELSCEYCRTRQEDEPFITDQIEHIIAIQHGGGDAEDNLALACSHCNLHKGPNLSGIDPLTDLIEILFHPRRQDWTEHFELHSDAMIGRTACGRTTIRVLAMNDPARIELRR